MHSHSNLVALTGRHFHNPIVAQVKRSTSAQEKKKSYSTLQCK